MPQKPSENTPLPEQTVLFLRCVGFIYCESGSMPTDAIAQTMEYMRVAGITFPEAETLKMLQKTARKVAAVGNEVATSKLRASLHSIDGQVSLELLKNYRRWLESIGKLPPKLDIDICRLTSAVVSRASSQSAATSNLPAPRKGSVGGIAMGLGLAVGGVAIAIAISQRDKGRDDGLLPKDFGMSNPIAADEPSTAVGRAGNTLFGGGILAGGGSSSQQRTTLEELFSFPGPFVGKAVVISSITVDWDVERSRSEWFKNAFVLDLKSARGKLYFGSSYDTAIVIPDSLATQIIKTHDADTKSIKSDVYGNVYNARDFFSVGTGYSVFDEDAIVLVVSKIVSYNLGGNIAETIE